MENENKKILDVKDLKIQIKMDEGLLTPVRGVNFSVYNALGRDNEIARKLSVKSGSDGGYRGSYSPFSFSLKWMPAVAWFCKF